MRRDPRRLADSRHDLLVIGGGINGACAAWDATLRGLGVALVDRGDFGAATSANSLKIIHGGLRYLQQADFRRMRETTCECSRLMRIAPHLVHPLPCLVATHGGLRESRQAFRVAMAVSDLVGFDRDRRAGPGKRLPRGRLVGREECLRLFPGFPDEDVTGGAVWYDGLVSDSERLTLSFLLSAAGKGAVLANYVEVDDFLEDAGSVVGVRARDRLSGELLEIRAQVVLNAAGPWAFELLRAAGAPGQARSESAGLALALNLVTPRCFSDYAVGFRSRRSREEERVGGARRYLFLVPWRDHTLIGTYYRVFTDAARDGVVTQHVIEDFLAECNEACPALEIGFGDLSFYHWGFLPRRGPGLRKPDLPLASRARIIDHAESGGPAGLITMVGVKYTTARLLAERAVDRVFARLGRSSPRCRTGEVLLWGSESLDPGSRELAGEAAGPSPEDAAVLSAQVRRAVREEMAVHLADVVFRRTQLGTGGCPSRDTLEAAAVGMGKELGWDAERRQEEIHDVLEAYPPLAALPPRGRDVRQLDARSG